MDHQSKYYITCEFEYREVNYIAYICPYYELSDFEMKQYKVTEFTYVVHLFSLEGFKTFEMFPDDQMHWTTNASALLIDREIADIIAYVLVNVLR